jgi:hypothetical protein
MAIRTLVLDCGPLENPSATTIHRIAQLQLAVHRRGLDLRLRNATDPLVELIGFVGLAGVLRVESGWQSEEREQSCRVEEERELGDPSA